LSVDLHTHSTQSDGTDPPGDIVALSIAAGLRGVALTDHDTLEGIPAAAAQAAANGIEFVPGIELSIEWPAGTFHLLVYHLSPGSGPLQDRLEAIRHARTDRNHRIIQSLRDLAVPIEYAEVAEEAGGGTVGRPHIAAVMVRKGVVPDVAAAFDRFLGEGRPAYHDRERLDPPTAIGLARDSGAVPVLAHPHTLGLAGSQLVTVLRELIAMGLGGLEAYYAEYHPGVRTALAELAHRLGLVATGGSDYHGTYKPDLKLGIGYGDLDVPDAALEALHAARERQ
jgi:predicted metal-dependent phosphoesterase TrpH